MGNRSNINLVGNTTEGQNVGTGTGVYKGKDLGNLLQYKSLQVTGTTMVITSDANNIYFSANTGGGGSGSGFTVANNGLCTNGTTTVGLGGTLANNTCINGNGEVYSLSLTGMSNMSFQAQQSVYMCGCNTALMVGTGGVCICGGGFTYMCNLPAKSSETCVVYIASDGKLATGTGGGGTSYWSSGATGLYPTNGENILLPPYGIIDWDDGYGSRIYAQSGSTSGTLNVCASSTSRLYLNSAGITRLFGGTILGLMTTATEGVSFSSNSSISYISPSNTSRSMHISASNGTTAGCMCVCGGYATSTGHGGDVILQGGTTCCNATGGHVILRGGSTICLAGATTGRIIMDTLPAKAAETNVLYIDGSGQISCGAAGGGGGSSAGVSGDTQFSDGSSGFVVTNSGVARNVDLGSYVLGVSNYVSGTTYSLIVGEGNEACDTYESFIGGYYNCHAGGFFPGLDIIYGENNCDLVNGYGNAIFGSYNCLACSNVYNIVAGSNNYVYCAGSSAIFGDSNEICSGSTYALVAGQQNCVLCDAGYVMVLGDNNRMCSDFAYILGSYNYIEECSWNSTALNWNNCVCYCVRGAMAHGNLSVAEVAHERTTGAGKFYYTEPNLVNHRTNTREINFFHQTTGTTDTRDLLTYYCHHSNPATRQCEHFPLTPNSTLAFKAQIVGQRISDGLSGSWFFEGVVKRNVANTVSFVGTPTVTCYLDTGFTGCACICANNTDKRLDLAVTGMTSTSIGWSATLWGTQVTKV